jgi:hypothetical protein
MLIDWRWSSEVASMRETRAGAAFAAVDQQAPEDAIVFGVVRGQSTLAALLSKTSPTPLQCVVGNVSVRATDLAPLFEGYSLPLYYEQRFNSTHHVAASMRRERGEGQRADWVFASMRLRCPGFPPSVLPLVGQHMTLRLDGRFEVSGIRVQPPAFPFAEDEQPRSSAPAVTVCVQYVFGAGYHTSHVVDFAAYYLLLGARRIVVFDSMEPEFTPGDEAQRERVAQRAAGLQSIATALGPRFQVVRGFCTHDTMVRATLNANCQVLAGNICLNAARAIDAASPSSYVLMVDLDEYLTPPMPRVTGSGASGTTEAVSESGRDSRLSGALVRMAARVAAGDVVTSASLSHARVDRTSALSPKGVDRRGSAKRGACIKFASVYFVAPRCGSHINLTAGWGGERSPAILRLTQRFGSDRSERGPSHTWRNLSRWDHRVRAKFLMDARAPSAVSAIHSCCLVAGQRAPRPPPEHGCAMVDHVPLEEWHLRHLKHIDEPCRTRDMKVGVHTLAALTRGHTNGEHGSAAFDADAELADQPLPASWAAEVSHAARVMSRRVTVRGKGRVGVGAG